MAKKPLFFASLMPEGPKVTMFKLIEEWKKAAEELAPMLEKEKSLRQQIFDQYFAPNPGLEEGTNHIDIGFGHQLTAQYRINRKVDEAQLDANIALGRISRTTVDDLFTYKPSLKVGEWKDADPETKKLFADIITETPGLPGLALAPIKK